MRKYVVGVIAGLLLGFTISAHAEEVGNLIGQAVQGTFPVKIEGAQLESPAIVVDNKTYLPVRAFGEAIGYNVGFDADLGVNLSKSVTDTVYGPSLKQQEAISTLQKVIESQKNAIPRLQKGVEMSRRTGAEEDIINFERQIEETKARITKLEAQLAELTAQ